MGRRSTSAAVDDCLEAAGKAIKKYLGGEVGSRDKNASVILLSFTTDGKGVAEAAAAILRAMVKVSCGSEKGTTKVPAGEVHIDTAILLPSKSFEEAIGETYSTFSELPDDNAGIFAVAEMAYMRHLQKHSELAVYLISNFPKCLLQANAARVDVSVAGYVMFSITSTGSKKMVLRAFPKSIDNVVANMCSSSFSQSVLPKKWSSLSTLKPRQVADLLEDAHLAISEYWNDSAQDHHSKSEVAFLMATVGSDLCAHFREAQVASDVYQWDKEAIQQALGCFDDWITICAKLTTLDWGSSWGSKFEDKNLIVVRNRLRTVLSYRELIEEVAVLLDADTLRSFKTEDIWQVFAGVNLFCTSPVTENEWCSGLSAFLRRLEPLEHRCAVALRNFFSSHSHLAPQTALHEFSRFRQLVKCPIVSKELVPEREGLLAKLNERLQSVRLEFEHRSESTEEEIILEEEDRRSQACRFMPGVVNNIIWLRQLHGLVKEMVHMCNSILQDLGSAKDFVAEAKRLLEEINDYEQETFRNWAMDVKGSSDSLTLDANAPLMHIDSEGQVEVNFPERLVQLTKEVRIFAAMGLRVPPEIMKIAKHGFEYYQRGVTLKHVANIYNSMAKDIIPCTQAMLLEPALHVEKVITASGNTKLTWRSKEEADHFIEKLRGAAQGLTDDNRRLHKLHREIGAIVQELFNIDLLRMRERWMSKVHLLREKIETSGFQNMGAWKLFWDMQLYKALECQYQLGLESLHETVSEIKAEIVYDAETGQAALRPPLEAIRQQYYQNIRDFLTFPIRFRGCGENHFFKDMPSRNEHGVYSVMWNATQLFKKVQERLKRYTPLLVIGRCGKAGNPTLIDIVSQCLTEVQHWEQSIRVLKQKGKEINAEDLFIKCDCITLCTAGIKGAVEEHISRFNDTLRVTLKNSTEKHLVVINEYLDRVAHCLGSKLTRLDEISESNMLYANLMEQRPSMEVEFHHFFGKNNLLQSMTGEKGLDFAATKNKWDSCMKRLDSHEEDVEEQLNQLKSSVDETVKSWQKDVERFTNQWHELKPKDMKATKPLEFVTQEREKFMALKERWTECEKQCQYFMMEEPDTQPLEDLEADIENYYSMWCMLGDFNEQLNALRSEAWISFRAKVYQFDDFLKLWHDKLKELPANPITVHIRSTMDEWGRCVSLFKYVRGDGFTPLHWSEMFGILRLTNVTQDTLRFGQLLDIHETLLKGEGALKKLHARAQGEAQIREALDDVRAWSTDAQFTLCPHPDRPGLVLITDWKDTMSSLSDNQALLISTKESPYFSLFASDATKWDERLTLLDEYLRNMNQIQRKWVYLEPIFRRGALPSEQERFHRIDKEYLQVMKVVQADSHLMALVAHSEFKAVLRNVLEQLERCQKSLNQYLEEKRDSFPRFYFISDDDLLEILAQSRNPSVIQLHLKKLFMGIHSVQFDNKKENIQCIYSAEGEAVPLNKPVRITDEVESWLTLLDVEMKETLKSHLMKCVAKMDIGAYASQVLCTAEMVNFTSRTEASIRDSAAGGLKKHKANLQAKLRELTVYAGSNSDVLIGIKLKALIMDLIHNIEVVELLIANNVEKDSDWLWRKQLRYYVTPAGECSLRMMDAQFTYSFEYQGNAPKLVHTPLTDRCYLTLTQGMHLGYGGNPYGPAGTGKTESVKALGNAMGRQVLVFNCDEGIDFKSMGRIFTGLVKCGAWGCFDEFNRLKVDQLSAVSQMIQVIQEALKNGERSCQLLGRSINVNSNAGIFVTLNPAGKGYGGRSKLPDNLKQLFRSIAMSAPDNELIMETILFSEGFENAKELAKKTVEIFSLSRQLLSHQQHYDWGLRAMKAVLRLGGTLIHSFLMDRVAGNVTVTSEEVLQRESEIIIKSLRVNTLSKLTYEDAILFNHLISDMFPTVAVLEIDYGELRAAIEESIKELNLQLVETQVHKILQLYEALRQRMGVVLVGPSGSGKSTLLKVLRKSLQRLGKTVPLYVVNPKALPREQLLGRMDPDTREWFDGVLTEAARKVVKEEGNVQSWVLCDGDIDPEWVESLNSVLDDNKLLTMPNGVRIQFGDNVNFLFETHSLEFASPATVSRMGIIFLSEEDVDAKSTIASWLTEQPEESRDQLKNWIDEYFYKAVDSLVATERLIVETTRTGLITSGLSQLQGCATKAQFALALIYGLGSYLPEEPRKDFAKDVLYLVGERAPDAKNPLNFKYDNDHHGYVGYEFEPPSDMTVEELYRHPLVATVDCQRNLEIMKAWSKPIKPGVYRPFVLVGPEGCGKTMLLTHLFANSSSTRVATVNCSAQTEAIHVIQKLRQTCQMYTSTSGKVLRPKEAERLVLLLKDLNLPKPDKYGTVQLHSLLQQLVLYSGYYDSDLEWVTVERVQIVGSMNPPGSMGRYPVAPRFLAIVSVLSIAYPSRESLQLIYSEFFNIMMQNHRLQLNIPCKGASDIARAMTTVYEIISSRCTVDVASHYIFNPRDITKWALNLLNYSVDVADAISYEGGCIFVDRLATPEERLRLNKVIKDNLTAALGSRTASDSDSDRVYYVSWLDGGCGPGRTAKKLLPTKVEDLKKSAEQMLLGYSREHANLSVPLIPEVCAWIARVDRVLSQERGNLLLVGRSGVCASEIVRLVAYNNRTEVMTLGLTREYSLKQFHSELKGAMTTAGVSGQSVVLLLEEYNFFNPHFLEAVNSLLSSGEVPGLFTPEEQDAVLGPLKEDAIGEGMTPYNYFVDRIARFLHVVVIMDPTSPNYEPQCRANPALFTRCNVYWMDAWQTNSLKLLPRLMMQNVYSALDSKEDEKKSFSLTSEIVRIHSAYGGRFSPQHFKVFCQTYQHIYELKSKQAVDGLSRLQTGVAKLDEAQENVDRIAGDVVEKKKLLQVKQTEADEALNAIQAKMEEAGEQKLGIHKIQKELAKEQKAITERKSVIENRLSGIQPTLDAALAAVSSIRSEHLSELKSMKQPPAAVQDVMEGVILLINGGKASDTTWAGIRKILAGDIKGQILNYDINNVTEQTRVQVGKFLDAKQNSFKRDVIGRASKAAAPMAEWLKAVIEYSRVLETVAPMRDELKEYEANLQHGQAKKVKYEGKLSKVEEKVNELKHKFGEKTTQAERLKDQLEQAESLLERATELLSKLGDEHSRWTGQMKSINTDLKMLPRRCLLAAGFITYLGREAEEVRQATLGEWQEKVKLPDFNFFSFLREESVQLHYKAEGLPGDELSMDNAVTIHEQINTPLIEDPSGLAMEWLVNNLRGRKCTVEVCSVSDERLVSALELALRFGKNFIVTDVDRIEPFMYPILRKELHNEGTKRVIQIGDRRTVDYADGFQLYLFTRSSEMRVPPDIAGYLTPVSFSITHSGLEGQFLGLTIQHEQPELESEKLSLLQKEEKLKMQLDDLEQSLLNNLANSKGSLLENSTLIESLNQIKTQASEISEALEKSKQLQEELDAKRNVYRPFANTASQTFFLVKSLRELSHMYQFSFGLFMDLFNRTLKAHKEDHTDTETKIEALKKTFVKLCVQGVSRSLMKEHRVTFGIHLARALHPNECTPAEWDYFVGKAIATEAKRKEVRVPTFVLPDSVETYRTFVSLFPDLVGKLRLQEADVWLQWMRTSSPEENYPTFLNPLTHFQRLLVVKTIRSDRLVAAMNLVACELLHVDSLDENSTLSSMLEVTDAATPILLITTAGADPSQELQNIAHHKVGKQCFHQLAMGGGQTEEAARLLKLTAEKGEWLFLKNLHLVIPWVFTLQKEINTLKPKASFRLFLTTEAHDEFPSILLSHSTKIAFESPPGIKQNLLRTYKGWGKSFYDSHSDLQKELLFMASSLHAVIQERHSYVPQGWSKKYEITAADLKSAADIVLSQSKQTIDWRSIRGLLENAIYGGKMESDFDSRILETYIKRFFDPRCLSTSKRPEPVFSTVRIPASGSHSDYVKIIKSLPDNDVPALFSLPPNSDRVVQLSRVRELMADLQRISEVKEAATVNREQWAAQLHPILNTWSELAASHPDLLTRNVAANVHVNSNPKPVEGFISADLSSALKLVGLVSACMDDLRKVTEGTALLTENRRAEASSMLLGDVPPHWDGFFPSSARILAWMQSLLRRAVALSHWHTMALNGNLLKNPLDLSCLLRAKTFLNALRQETAQVVKQPLVSLTLVAKPSTPPENALIPVCLEGLLLQGAVLDDDDLLQSIETADVPALYPIAKVYVAWVPVTADHPKTYVDVPVYANCGKENYLCDFQLPCASELAVTEFVLAGVSIVLEQ